MLHLYIGTLTIQGQVADRVLELRPPIFLFFYFLFLVSGRPFEVQPNSAALAATATANGRQTGQNGIDAGRIKRQCLNKGSYLQYLYINDFAQTKARSVEGKRQSEFFVYSRLRVEMSWEMWGYGRLLSVKSLYIVK